MKTCPYCAEEIQDMAIVCRYCGRELEPDGWELLTYVYHWRNKKETGYMSTNETPGAQASLYYWNKYSQEGWSELDQKMISMGWRIVEPRGAACIKLEIYRNLIFGIQLWWPSSLTLKWKKPSDENSEKTVHWWLVNNEWEAVK